MKEVPVICQSCSTALREREREEKKNFFLPIFKIINYLPMQKDVLQIYF